LHGFEGFLTGPISISLFLAISVEGSGTPISSRPKARHSGLTPGAFPVGVMPNDAK
jgi:hypothetical protein